MGVGAAEEAAHAPSGELLDRLTEVGLAGVLEEQAGRA
jgi:hypothetical protein